MLILKYKNIDYTAIDVARIVGISKTMARRRINQALAGKIPPAEVFRKKGSHTEKLVVLGESRLPEDLTSEQLETLNDFLRMTRNDDKLIKKYYA